MSNVQCALQFNEQRLFSAAFLHMLGNKFYRQRWYLLTLKTNSNLWQTEFVVACVGSHYPFASTKSLAIYYSGSFTSALVIAEPRKFPYAIALIGERERECAHRRHRTETKLMHFIWFISSLMSIFVAKKESRNSAGRPLNTYKLIRKLVSLKIKYKK